MKFVNLKLHSDYSLLEGVAKVSDYIKKAKECNQDSISISDTAMFSSMKMYQQAILNDIKPIFSLELKYEGIEEIGSYAITAYAKNMKGYVSLIELETNKYDLLKIARLSSDLVITIGGVNSEILKLIKEKKYLALSVVIKKLKELFPNFYLEIPAINLSNELLEKYIDLIEEYNLEYIISSDTYYLEKEDKDIQMYVLAIKENTTIDKLKTNYEEYDLSFKTDEDVRSMLSYLDDKIISKGIDNIRKIVEECNVVLDDRESKIPSIATKEELYNLCLNGIDEKVPFNKREEYIKRLDYEIDIIDKMGFNAYFVIVKDIVDFAKREDILVGPGRGSAAGSLVSYLLGITKIDPLEYGLMFERFLNFGRKSMPDIDLDFELNKRDRIIQYVMEKYGKDNVSNIIVFSTLKEKQLKRDIERVSKNKLGNIPVSKVIEKLENNVRHRSIHASGVVISKDPLKNLVPIIYEKDLNINITEYTMEDLEKLGLLKMDFLSLANLDIIAKCIRSIGIKLEDIPLDDKKAFDMYNRGDTLGLFQVESYGITALIKRLKITKFLDISVALALYRPGPLKSGMVDEVIKNKNGKLEIHYDIPEIKDILESTYGIILYQEQVMEIAKRIANYSLVEADDLRRAISKMKPEILKKHKERFINNAIKNGYEIEKIEKLYEWIENFGAYGFNKSHTIPYALVSYYTAYLKANYTADYMVSLLNEHMGVFSKLNSYWFEMKKFDIYMLSPDINISLEQFIKEGNNIRYALNSINGISKNFSKDIVRERSENGNFKNINDFTTRMMKYGINKKQFESLVLSGSLDSFGISRKELIENATTILENAKIEYESESNIGKKLFFMGTNKNEEYVNQNIEEYSISKIIDNEIEKIGIPLKYDFTNSYANINRFFKNSKIKLVFCYTSNTFSCEGNIYKTNIDLSTSLHKICLAKEYKGSILGIRQISDIVKLKDVQINILLDNISEENKNKLKEIIKNSSGINKIEFYKNKKKLSNNKHFYISLTENNLKKLVEITGVDNIRVEVLSLK